MSYNWQPILENDLVRLTPLKKEDLEPLYEVAADPLIWEQHPAKYRYRRPEFELFFKEALDTECAFLIRDQKTGEVIGSSRFNQLEGHMDKIEIGWTFLARKYWGGIYNRALKGLMIKYALKYVEEVIFFIGEDNIRSQRSVEKLGAIKTDLISKSNDHLTYRINQKSWKDE